MEIKYKLYPYPVLSPYSDDYKLGLYAVAIAVIRDGYDLRIDFTATLTSAGLMELVTSGKAKYVYHIECSQTGFRAVVQTDKINYSYVLDNKKVNGRLQICPFIVAVEDISYASADFHGDYEGLVFDIEAGCILAVGNTISVDISKDRDELVKAPSIFKIVKNADTSARQMLVDMSTRKILVKLPLNDYYYYKQLNKTPEAQPILNSMTVVPVLIYVLEELRALTVQDRREYSGYLWYRALNRTLTSKFNCDIEGDEFSNKNCIELAQKLVNNPLSEALHMLSLDFGNNGGDDV